MPCVEMYMDYIYLYLFEQMIFYPQILTSVALTTAVVTMYAETQWAALSAAAKKATNC